MNNMNGLLDALLSADSSTKALIVTLVVILTIVLCLPMVLVLLSKQLSPGGKTFWFIMTALFSWLAYPGFLLATRKNRGEASEAAKRSA